VDRKAILQGATDGAVATTLGARNVPEGLAPTPPGFLVTVPQRHIRPETSQRIEIRRFLPVFQFYNLYYILLPSNDFRGR
jgi:hypothetical protein